MTEGIRGPTPEANTFPDNLFPMVKDTTLGLFQQLAQNLPLHDKDPAGTFINFCEDIVKGPSRLKRHIVMVL